VTYVVALGFHLPLALAKRSGTLDRLSGGRVTLGVGVGSLQEEFALLGAPFSDRGRRADDAMAALRVSLGSRNPSYQGPYYAFDDVVVAPTAVQQHVPLWVGGRSEASLHRAVRFGDGWAPFALGPRAIGDLLAGVEPPPGFEVVLGLGLVDPMGDGEALVDKVRRAEAAGATRVNASLTSRSPAHYSEQLVALAEVCAVVPA
jgi:hypothetical protein